MKNTPSRRLFAGSIVAGGLGIAVDQLSKAPQVPDRRKPASRVAILRQGAYDDSLDRTLLNGLRLFGLNLAGKKVLLKPNLVESLPGPQVTTNPRLIGAAAAAFLEVGAASVAVGEGPGHQRDTYLILEKTGLRAELKNRGVQFVDLNRDDPVRVPLRTRFTDLDFLWLPRTVLESDVVVSMPKVKTHHWAGVTLSLKNMFGVLPGLAYGWPKNILHWKGIERSILDVAATAPVHFVIADGVIAMEGNGPLHGPARTLGYVVMADDPVAADFTCARLMGINPGAVPHLNAAAQFLGNGTPERIIQLAVPMPSRTDPFAVLPDFKHLLQSAFGKPLV